MKDTLPLKRDNKANLFFQATSVVPLSSPSVVACDSNWKLARLLFYLNSYKIVIFVLVEICLNIFLKDLKQLLFALNNPCYVLILPENFWSRSVQKFIPHELCVCTESHLDSLSLTTSSQGQNTQITFFFVGFGGIWI